LYSVGSVVVGMGIDSGEDFYTLERTTQRLDH